MKKIDSLQKEVKEIDSKKQKVTFKDFAGNENAKDELKEVVDFLKNPKKYTEKYDYGK
ncbi:MAG: hypothetical protein WCI27_00335 [Candidatus Omnitrophota bacterium]